MHLTSGHLWPMPITLDLKDEEAQKYNVGDKVALRDFEGNLLALMDMESKWVPDKKHEAEKVFGSPDDLCHPAIKYLFDEAGSTYFGGKLTGVQLPCHYDFVDIRRTFTLLRLLLIPLSDPRSNTRGALTQKLDQSSRFSNPKSYASKSPRADSSCC